MAQRILLTSALAIGVIACSSNRSGPGESIGGSLTVTGEVVDFQTGAAISSAASVSTSGLLPAPRVTSQGVSFTIEGIPENSTFQILAAAPPGHRGTYSAAVVLTSSDLDGVNAPTVSEALLQQLAAGFGVTPSAAKGVLFVHLVDATTGAAKSGIAGNNLVIGGAIGPRFLDAKLSAQPNATASSASGWAVFFEVPAGAVALGSPAGATVTLDMATSPINAGLVTLAEAKVTNGVVPLPTNVSFANTVYPIFTNRGCVACHSGGGIGKELGGLKLDGSANSAYKELVLEQPNTRVQTATPDNSLVLRYPSREEPPDRHPNITFASALDSDYLKILVWIREGARDN